MHINWISTILNFFIWSITVIRYGAQRIIKILHIFLFVSMLKRRAPDNTHEFDRTSSVIWTLSGGIKNLDRKIHSTVNRNVHKRIFGLTLHPVPVG